jgi:UDP-GlcNAc3NAcA epimerase
MGIPEPDYNLNIHSLSHGAMTGRMIEEIEKLLLNFKFDYIIVYGDTNSTLAGTIAASKLNIKIVHVEAGVRNYDNTMPEEINRIVTDRLSDILLCCTDEGVMNLNKEGISYGTNTGDLMYDALLLFKDKIKKKNIDPYVLVTCHRASNTNKKTLTEIINALNTLSKDTNIVFPIHPRTKKIISTLDITPNFKTIEPVSYIEMLELINNCKFVITDSGGVVREAYFLNKPSLLLLKNPLWPELTKSKVCFNCSPTTSKILLEFNKLKKLNLQFPKNLLGDGNSRKYIVDKILNVEKC